MSDAKRYTPEADAPLTQFSEHMIISGSVMDDSKFAAKCRGEVKEKLQRRVGAALVAWLMEYPTGKTVQVQIHHQVISSSEQAFARERADEKHLVTLTVYPAQTRGAVEIIVSQEELNKWNALGAAFDLGSVANHYQVKCPDCGRGYSLQVDLNDLTSSPRGQLQRSVYCAKCAKTVPVVVKIEEPPAPSAARLKNVSEPRLLQ
jgi:hypothetical protein